MRGSPHLLGGEPPPVRFVYWLLIAIYTFAALAQGALTGDELVCAAAAVPALVLSAPVLGAQLASAVTDAAAGLLPSPEAESEEWHATMDAWLDSFMSSYRSQHHHDRRSSNGGGHAKEIATTVDCCGERSDRRCERCALGSD